MPPIIEISDEDYQALRQLGIKHSLVETPKPEEKREEFVVNPADYIFLEGKSGREGYPDLHVCKYRLGASPAVISAGNDLGLNLEDTARELNGRGYLGRINREQALKLNLMLGGRTMSTRIARDFLRVLFSSKAFDGNGKRISSSELSKIADEKTAVESRYRSEWYEDFFTQGEDSLILNKNYVLEKGVLVPHYTRKLTTCLIEDRAPGISLKSWLDNSTAQGYPRKNVESGDLWYFGPRSNSAVRFVAGSDDAYFGGSGDPLDAGDRLGVRHVREAHAKK